LLSLKAGGVGLTLTRATHVVHYDRWWNPAVEDQATDRAYRIGQDRPVQVHRLVTENTLEDRIATVINAKRDLADAVVGSGEAWLEALEHRARLDPGRLSRGRSYARRGSVLELTVSPGEVEAAVQGSRVTPYQVTVRIRAFSADEWNAVLDIVSAQIGRV